MNSASSHVLTSLRWITLAEGFSFIGLLLIAMPLKYLAHLPIAVKIAGTIHGGLFILLILNVLIALQWTKTWSFKRSAEVLAVSLIPFASLFFDRKMRHYLEEEFRS